MHKYADSGRVINYQQQHHQAVFIRKKMVSSIIEESLNHSLNFGSSIFYFLLLIFSVLTLYHFWFQSLRYVKLGNKIPGYDPIPIFGNAHLAINKTPIEIMKYAVQMVEKYGNVVRVWFGSRLGVVLIDPRDIELILGSPVHLEKSSEYGLFEPWLGDGLLISKGEKWRSHRKMIAPTFHQSILKTFIPTFNKNADDLVQQLRKETLGCICDIHDYMSGATVDVLLETVMGVKKSKEAQSSYKYAKAVMDMCNILHLRHVRIWLRPNFIFKFTNFFKEQNYLLNIIHTLTDAVIEKKKIDYFQRSEKGDVSLYNTAVREQEEEMKQSKIKGPNYGSSLRDDLDENDENVGEKKRLAFLDFMIEASQTEGNKLSDTEIREEVNTIMFEGHDTTAAASSFFICILGVYPDIQEKVYQELEEIFQGSDRPITFNDVLEMKYLERVLLETLRMFPPVPIITRVIHEDIKLASANYIVPKGSTVAIAQFLVHRNPEFYPNPNKFDPDNFLPERCQQRHYYSFIPFSAGPRSCVGRKYAMLKLKILLAKIVRNFKIKSVVSVQDFELQADIILKRSDGFRVILEDRNK